MLERIKLTSFQRHERLVIDLDSAVTTLVGPSDAGKTSVLRALRWVCLNTPTRANFVTRGKEKVLVSLRVDGHTVRRLKGGENSYYLDKKKFVSFQTGVPEEIANLLNVGPQNFQQQFSLHFWFADTPGQVSKELNKIVNLEVIDSTLANLAGDLRSARSEESVSRTRLKEARGKRNQLRWAKEFALAVDALELNNRTLIRTRESLARLRPLLESGRTARRTLNRAAEGINRGSVVLETVSGLERVRGDRQHLEGLLAQCNTSVPRPPEGLSRLTADLDRVSSQRKRLAVMIEEIKQWQQKQDALSESLTQTASALNKLGRGRCPVCGSRSPKASK